MKIAPKDEKTVIVSLDIDCQSQDKKFEKTKNINSWQIEIINSAISELCVARQKLTPTLPKIALDALEEQAKRVADAVIVDEVP